MQRRKEVEALGPSFVFGWQYYDEILIALESLHFGKDFEVFVGENCMISIQCDIDIE
jgi:hypothetical protein